MFVRFVRSYIKFVYVQLKLDIIHGHEQKTPVVKSRNTSVRFPGTDYVTGLPSSREAEIVSSPRPSPSYSLPAVPKFGVGRARIFKFIDMHTW
jgi:hypothetical protein